MLFYLALFATLITESNPDAITRGQLYVEADIFLNDNWNRIKACYGDMRLSNCFTKSYLQKTSRENQERYAKIMKVLPSYLQDQSYSAGIPADFPGVDGLTTEDATKVLKEVLTYMNSDNTLPIEYGQNVFEPQPVLVNKRSETSGMQSRSASYGSLDNVDLVKRSLTENHGDVEQGNAAGNGVEDEEGERTPLVGFGQLVKNTRMGIAGAPEHVYETAKNAIVGTVAGTHQCIRDTHNAHKKMHRDAVRRIRAFSSHPGLFISFIIGLAVLAGSMGLMGFGIQKYTGIDKQVNQAKTSLISHCNWGFSCKNGVVLPDKEQYSYTEYVSHCTQTEYICGSYTSYVGYGNYYNSGCYTSIVPGHFSLI
eukprot:NODE_190_length_13461_cov_0.525595.p3 type:complete len:367 gc:universal NODE_190_length_13461_cov_0.525595:1980-3080(+)